MKYMLMMNAPGKVPYQIFSWPKQDIQAHIGGRQALRSHELTVGRERLGEAHHEPRNHLLLRAARLAEGTR